MIVGEPGLCDAYPRRGLRLHEDASVTSNDRVTVAVDSLLVNW